MDAQARGGKREDKQRGEGSKLWVGSSGTAGHRRSSGVRIQGCRGEKQAGGRVSAEAGSS